MTRDSRTSSVASDASGGLRRDLALVLPTVELLEQTEITAFARGKSVALENAIETAAALLDAGPSPAIVGLNHLTMEAVREAVALAEKMRGRLLPWPVMTDPTPAKQAVTQTAGLGHVFSCEMIVWVGCDGAAGKIAERIAERQLLAAFVKADLETVQRLRGEMKMNPGAEPIGKFRRVAAVLSPACDGRVAGQWHKLAAELQEHVRLCVFPLPPPEAANARGANEVVTWQTGLSLTNGGIDFADGGPRGCSALFLKTDRGSSESPHPGPLPGGEGVRVFVDDEWIAIGPSRDDNAEISFVTPGLAAGLAARVMRCDGIILWLCDDPAAAPPDPTVDLLRRIGEKVGTHT